VVSRRTFSEGRLHCDQYERTSLRGGVHFYHGRGTAEQWIKEGKYALNWTRLSCPHFVSNQVRLALFVLAYNLGDFLRRLVLPRRIQHWSLRSLFDQTNQDRSEGGLA